MQPMQLTGRVAIIIVSHGHETSLPALLKRVGKEKRPDDFLIVVDNHPGHRGAAQAQQFAAVDKVIKTKNRGFAAACNQARAAVPIGIELLLLLNPDVTPKPHAITKLRTAGQPDWGAWMGILTLPKKLVNSAGNIVHMSGLSWCDAYGQPLKEINKSKQQVQLVSGACVMIRKSAWDAVSGLSEDYFLYYEDTDLSVLLWSKGYQLGLVPAAQFEHDYNFDRGDYKWFYLERNRYLFILRQWPLSVIAVLSPFLIAVEVGLWAISIQQRRFIIRCKAVVGALRLVPKALSRRRRIRRTSQITSLVFFDHLSAEINTPLLGRLGQSNVMNGLFRAYYQLAREILALCSAF